MGLSESTSSAVFRRSWHNAAAAKTLPFSRLYVGVDQANGPKDQSINVRVPSPDDSAIPHGPAFATTSGGQNSVRTGHIATFKGLITLLFVLIIL
jgi:hypothetical protein